MSDQVSNGVNGDGSSDRSAISEAWRTLLRSVGLGRNGTSAVRASLEELIDENGEDSSPIDPHEGAIIRNVLGLRDITAVDVMVPRVDIFAVDVTIPMKQLAAEMSREAHSRVPVYRGTLDDVVGMIHIKDVVAYLNRGENPPLSQLVRDVLYVAPSSRALDLLQEMRIKRRHLALVVDEYGGIDGLITIEDLVEEIVGEITDEHEVVERPKLSPLADGALIADARATVEEFEEIVGSVLTDDERDEIDTLGGLVFSLAGRIPARGELISHPSGIEFEVTAADPRRIRTLKVHQRSGAEKAAE